LGYLFSPIIRDQLASGYATSGRPIRGALRLERPRENNGKAEMVFLGGIPKVSLMPEHKIKSPQTAGFLF
jgi:hypothetical protein